MARELFKDVDMTHPWVAQYRLPVVTRYGSISNYSGYIVSVLVPDETDEFNELFNIGTPTDEDAAIIASYLEYKIGRLGYRDGYRLKMLEKPLDVDEMINTITILKRKDGSWAYQRVTWGHPPKPFFNASYVPKSIVELLDYIEKDFALDAPDPKWTEWKKEHGIS